MRWVGREGQAGPRTATTWPAGPTRLKGSAGGQTRTVDPALMRRVLSPTELLRPELLMLTRTTGVNREQRTDSTVRAEQAPPLRELLAGRRKLRPYERASASRIAAASS